MAQLEATESALSDGTCYVIKLREALMAAAVAAANDADISSVMRRVDLAADPLIDRCYARLLHYCDRLARGCSGLKDSADGVDLAQDAWAKVLRYLKSERGARVRDDDHFFRLLLSAAKTRFLDILQAPVASTDETPSLLRNQPSAQAVDAFDVFGSDRAIEMIELLFMDEQGFRESCRKPARRRLLHYRAYVLYQLGQYLLAEGVDERAIDGPTTSIFVVGLLRHYVVSLGIAANQWQAIESTAIACSTEPVPVRDLKLAESINRICGSAIKPGNYLAVLRHELNGLVSG